MRRVLALLFMVSCFGLSAQEEWYLDKPIVQITFTGLSAIKENELKPIARPYIDKPFSMQIFYELQEKLYALEYFESIEANALPGDDEKKSVIVDFKVVEKPSVSELILKGNRNLRKGEILEKVLIKQGDMASQSKVNMDAEAITALYREKGYMDARVRASLEPDKEKNTVQVVFDIVEGFQTTIKEIRFSGNSFASDNTLRKTMKTKAQALFSKGILEESKLEEDIRLIQSYYGERGYIDAKVEKVDRQAERDEQAGKNFLILTLYLKEGDQYAYGGLGFSGNQIFSTETLSALVRQKQGAVLNKTKLEADFQRVADLYYENGYIFNVLNREESRDEKQKTITYTIRIMEKDRAHIENIRFKGNEKTKDFVIYRELPFEEGDIFSKKQVLQGLRNLYNLQYFSSITPETPPGSAEGLMDLVLNIEEGSTANINFGVMFSGGDSPISGMLKWSENNFLGRGQTLSVDLEVSPLRQMISLSFEEPWMFAKRWLGGISLSLEHALVTRVYQDILPPIFTGDEDNAVPDPFTGVYVDPDTGEPSEESDKITDYEYALRHGQAIAEQYTMDYTLWRLSSGLSSGYRYYTPAGWLGIRSQLSTNLEFIAYDDTLYRPFDQEVRDNQDLWSVVNKLGITLYWDGRDYFWNPTKGFYLAQAATFTGGFLGGRRHYIRTDSTAEGFLTLLNLPVTNSWSLKMVFAAHSALSFILPQFGMDEPVTVPTDLLYIDGMTVARGWPLMKERKALWDNRLELRLPISEQFLWWTFFLDGATAWYEIADMKHTVLDDFFFSLGGGIRFTIPQFPIRLYLAQRFRFDNGKLQWVEGGLPFLGMKLDFVISLGGGLYGDMF